MDFGGWLKKMCFPFFIPPDIVLAETQTSRQSAKLRLPHPPAVA